VKTRSYPGLTTTVSDPFIDTNVIVGALTSDDLSKQDAAIALFERVERGQIAVMATDSIIADCVYVLSSPRLYNLPWSEIADALLTIVEMPGFQVPNKRVLVHALQLYGYSGIKFDDAHIIAAMTSAGSGMLYSWDRGFDRVADIERVEP
jgi:predicted nucleic acid-binding protein